MMAVFLCLTFIATIALLVDAAVPAAADAE